MQHAKVGYVPLQVTLAATIGIFASSKDVMLLLFWVSNKYFSCRLYPVDTPVSSFYFLIQTVQMISSASMVELVSEVTALANLVFLGPNVNTPVKDQCYIWTILNGSYFDSFVLWKCNNTDCIS